MKGTPLTEEIYEYIVSNFAFEERTLQRSMSERAEAAGIPMIMIGEDQAKFVAFFLRAIKARRVLDVGTLFGYSAAIMARAIGEKGEVISLEFNPAHAAVAKENLAHFGIEHVTITVGAALDSMKKLPMSSFDFILIDADKPNYTNYLRESLRLIRPGGVIAGDNAIAWGRIADETITYTDPDYSSVTSIQAFNKAVAAEGSMFSIILPIGDGMAMGVVEK
ncbi:MAG TPA: O-methyltransferase [Candidatus Kapabacteria bacterium]|jgi:predicted O-methyltransferase YrrM|nr:O-methyltransferase [Candidatus Kapabacteria bacterium]